MNEKYQSINQPSFISGMTERRPAMHRIWFFFDSQCTLLLFVAPLAQGSHLRSRKSVDPEDCEVLHNEKPELVVCTLYDV